MYIVTLYAWIATIRTLLNKTPKQSVPRTTPKRHRFTVIGVIDGNEIFTFSFNVLAETADIAAVRAYGWARKHGFDTKDLANVMVVPGWDKVVYSL